MEFFQQTMQKLELLSQDPQFQKNSAAILFFEHTGWLFLAMAVYLIAYLFLRYYVLKTMPKWWARQLWKVPLSGVFLLGEFLISYAFLGQPWVDFLKAVYTIA